jgi:cytochrome c oxidase subunit I
LLSKNGAPGDVMTPEFYLQLMTMHATIMVFFVLTTAPFAAFGNYFLPIQVGAEDMPFPHFNMMSFWVTFVAFLVLMSSFFVGTGSHARRLDAVRSAQRIRRGWRSR